MVRSKEQWKAQQRALHTQNQSQSFSQIKRPLSHPPGVRPTAPLASSALFQLGRPTNGAPFVAAERPVVFKPDPEQTPSSCGNSSGQAIDLTLDDDDEDEDEPMWTQQSVPGAAAAAAATTTNASSAASDAVKLSTLGIDNNKEMAVAQSLQQSSDMMVPEAEEIESDVDEDWPAVPPITSSPMPLSLASSVHDLATSLTSQSMSSRTTMPTPVSEPYSHGQTQKNDEVALDTMCKALQDQQKKSDLERVTQMEATRQQTLTPALVGDGDDVDEDLRNQAREAEKDTAGLPSPINRVVEAESLEDGEIFEEGAAPKPTMQAQQAMMRENRPGQLDAYPMDAMGIRPHQRVKKQKKRGKKKSKRKLEAMQMMHTPPGEIIPDFERATRRRPFAEGPPPGQYTLAMMRNDPRSNVMNIRPVFQDPPPAPFQPGRPAAAGVYPPMRPSPQHHLQNPPMPPPPPYEDSQILRVNRQGGMEMLGVEVGRPLNAMFSEPLMQGGFKYRSVPITAPSRPMPGIPSHQLQRSVSDQSRLPPIPHQSRARTSSPVPTKERNDSDDFDLDSLRAAALRSKVNRSLKTSTTPTDPPTTEMDTSSSLSSSSPPRPSHVESKRSISEPASPKSENELRLEILRSMTRNRQRAVDNEQDDAQVSTPLVRESNTVDRAAVDDVINDKPSPAQATVITVDEALKATQPKISDTSDAERVALQESSSQIGESIALLQENGAGDKAEPPSISAVDQAKPSAEHVVTTPEFRPLTACSQSLVITLSPEDFSPRKGGEDTRTKATASSSLQDAIKEMRRKIAEREKEQTSRLLENAAARVLKHPSMSSSSPASLSSTPCQLSPKKKVSTVVTLLSGATTKNPVVRSSATEVVKKPPTGPLADKADNERTPGSIGVQTSVGVEEGKPSQLAACSPTDTAAAQKPESETRERSNISGVSIFVDMRVSPPVLQPQVPASSDGRNGDRASQPCVKKSIEPAAAA